MPGEDVWAISEFGEPEPSPPADGADILGHLPALRLSQVGRRLTLTRFEYCGKPSEEASGPIDDNRVRLEGMSYRGRLGAPLVYELSFDVRTRRFRGTRNGQPVWLGPTRLRPSPASLCGVAAFGRVFGPFMQEVGVKATVRALSLNPSNPYDGTVDVGPDGTFVFNSLPGGVPLSLTVQAEGYLPRAREVVIERGPRWLVNFGGPKDREDPEGWKFALEPIVKPSPAPSGPSDIQLF
jgi:hypothetical protein